MKQLLATSSPLWKLRDDLLRFINFISELKTQRYCKRTTEHFLDRATKPFLPLVTERTTAVPMSSTTVLSARQPSVSSIGSQLRNRQTSYPAPRTHRTAPTEQSHLASSQPSMYSAAAFGQRPTGYEAGNRRDSYTRQGVPTQRLWAIAGQDDGQSWEHNREYHGTNSQGPVLAQQRHHTSQQAHLVPQLYLPNSSASHVSRQSTRPSTPNSTRSSHTGSGSASGGDDSMVKHSLQIPARISPRGGNLADFAAQVRSSGQLRHVGLQTNQPF